MHSQLNHEITAPTSIKPRRQRLTQSDWKNLITQWESSDQTQKAFCEAQGLCYRNFSQWKSRLKRQPSSISKDALVSSFIPLSVTELSSAMGPSSVRLSINFPGNIKATLESDVKSVAAVVKTLLLPSC